MADTPSNVVLRPASVDPDATGDLRILVDHRFSKYITIDAGICSLGDMCYGPSLVSQLPHLPRGIWNKTHISKDLETGDPCLSDVSQTQLLGVLGTLHPARADHMTPHDGLSSWILLRTCPCAAQRSQGCIDSDQALGDINKHNFRIHNGKATRVDLGGSLGLADEDELQADLQQLRGWLCDEPGRSGMVMESVHFDVLRLVCRDRTLLCGGNS